MKLFMEQMSNYGELQKQSDNVRRKKLVAFDLTSLDGAVTAILAEEAKHNKMEIKEDIAQAMGQPADTKKTAARPAEAEAKDVEMVQSASSSSMGPKPTAAPSKEESKKRPAAATLMQTKPKAAKGAMPPPPPPKAPTADRSRTPTPRGSVGQLIQEEVRRRGLAEGEKVTSNFYEIEGLAPGTTTVLKSIELPGTPEIDMEVHGDAYWISRKLCGLLRGFDHDRKHWNVQPPEMDHDFWVRVPEAFTFIKRRYLKKLSLPDFIRAIRSNDRFMVRVTASGFTSDGSRELVMENLAYHIEAVKCIQGHTRTLLDQEGHTLTGTKRRVMTANPWKYGPEDYEKGAHAGIPKYSHLVMHTIWPKILCHYTTYDCIERIIAFGLFPGGAVSSKPYVFLTDTSPWQASGSREEDLMRTRPLCVALDTELMVFQEY